MFIVGIDIAKRNHAVKIITSEGESVCKTFFIRNNCTGYNLLLGCLQNLTICKSEFIIAMESTAHYWLPLYTRLRKDGYTVVVLNPIQTYAMRDLLIRETKTDHIDALLIAEVIRFGRYSASNVPKKAAGPPGIVPKSLLLKRSGQRFEKKTYCSVGPGLSRI